MCCPWTFLNKFSTKVSHENIIRKNAGGFICAQSHSYEAQTGPQRIQKCLTTDAHPRFSGGDSMILKSCWKTQPDSIDRRKPRITFWVSFKQRNNFNCLVAVTRPIRYMLKIWKKKKKVETLISMEFVSSDDVGSNVKSLLEKIRLRI